MAETALNFGPDWIRALAAAPGTSAEGGAAAAAPPLMSAPRYKLAEHRYGREEMLGLIPKEPRAPEGLKQFEHLAKHNFQIPLALTPMSEEEQYLWTSRYLNSDASLRGKTGPGGYGMNRLGRGGSVDRGRGRGRGGYYQRGMMHEDSPDGPPYPRQKTIERSLSANEKDHRWDERDRRYDRPYSGRGMDDNTYVKHDNSRGPNDHWRKYDDEGDWRNSGSRSYDKSANRGSWRSERDTRREAPDRNYPQNRNSGGNIRGGALPQQRHSSWKEDNQGRLPEWSVEEVAEPDTVGTFDSSGAFMETKTSEDNTTLDEVYVSDDADEGNVEQDSPEAKKESLKKTPKKTPAKHSANKKNSKPPSESKSNEESPPRESTSPPKSTPKGAKPKEKQPTPDPKPQRKDPSPPKQTPPLPKGDKGAPRLPESSAKSGDTKNSENVLEEDAFAHHQKATEHMVAQWTEEIEQPAPPPSEDLQPIVQEKDTKWFYQDPQGEIQGPFASHEMLEWFSSGYFTMSLMVRRTFDETFSQLGDLIKSWGRVPFTPGTAPPPIRGVPLPPSLSSVPNIPTTSQQPAPSAQLPPKPDEQLLALQQQLFQQQLMQQQLMMRQAQMQQLLTQLKTQDNFASLSSQQQQQVLMQQFMAQVPRPGLKPMGDPSMGLDPMAALSHPLMGLPLPPMMKSDLWQSAPEAGNWPLNVNTPQPASGSIWDIDAPKPNEAAELEKRNLAEEQEKMRKAEEVRLQQERELEEQRNKEELRRKQEEEEERKRVEEIRRQEAERQLKEELKRLEEEQRRREAEQQRKEEEKRRAEEEAARRLEEERRMKEELQRQEEAKRLLEAKKAEEKRRKEETLKRQLEKEKEKLLEVERQKEALRLKEAEREERLIREKREREEAELRKLAELKIKSQGPVWGIQKSQADAEVPLSLADIQRLQEEKEREEREEKMRQQLLQQQAVKHVQVQKNNLTWAKRANDCTPVVKSLSEIQQEEAERLAQLSRMQKPQAPAPPVNSNAGVWGNSSHLNKITAPPTAGWTNSSGGFWDDAVLTTTPAKKQAPPPKANNSGFPSLAVPARPAPVSAKGKNSKAKRDEDAVTRLFGSHHKPTDEFTKWCTDAISAMPSSVDVPTFVAFLKDIESPYEVYDYVKSYFGEGKEPREFAKLFMEKRSKFRNQAKQAPAEDNSLWGPAPAITPAPNKPASQPPTMNDNNNDAVSKGGKGAKKKKGRMQKLDNSLLGFTVQPNPDRVNAGEIDHIDHV